MATKKKTTRKKSTNKNVSTTLGEFKAKLEGIELFNDTDWCPDKTQWDLIREMIDNIEDVSTVQIEHSHPEEPTFSRMPPRTPPIHTNVPPEQPHVGNVNTPTTQSGLVAPPESDTNNDGLYESTFV